MKLENHLKILTYDKLRAAIVEERTRLQKLFDETPTQQGATRASLASRMQLLGRLISIEYRVTDE